MNAFDLTVSSPDGDLFRGDCARLDVRGVEGELAVMAGHVPFVTWVVPGPCKLTMPDGSQKNARREGGLLTVGRDGVIFLSGTFRIEE